MNFQDVAEIAAALTSLKFFPADKAGRLAIMKIIGRMATDADQVQWLVNRMLELFDEWPGPRTMRAVFCKRFKPADGVDLRTAISERYPEGIPNETQEAVPMLALPPGHLYTADPKLDEIVQTAIATMPKMPRMPKTPAVGEDGRFTKLLEETITAPCDRKPAPGPTQQIITQEDVEKELKKIRQSREHD